MKEIDRELGKIFSEEGELPEVVCRRKEEAYDMIYALPEKKGEMRLPRLPRAAVFLVGAVLILGSSAVATKFVQSRYERMRQMSEEELQKVDRDIESAGNVLYTFSREMSGSERRRLEAIRSAYKYNEAFPEGELVRISDASEYDGKGICLYVSGQQLDNIIYLPERELSDEELLEIVEYEEKIMYVLQERKKEGFTEQGDWAERMSELTDEEADYYFLAGLSNRMDVSGGFCREIGGILHGGMDNAHMLSEEEETLYGELLRAYEEDGLFPAGEAAVINSPDEYSGSGVAMCRYDGNYYIPAETLTREELLEIIDFRHKVDYSMERINDEIRIGQRSEWPTLSRQESEEFRQQNEKTFAETEGRKILMKIGSARVGDMVEFGTYEQDGNTLNGAEGILWYVVDSSMDTFTLLSVNILEVRPFQDTREEVVWAESDLRRWLNEDFYQSAFTFAERLRIVENPVTGNGGEDDGDMVTLLSSDEVRTYFKGEKDSRLHAGVSQAAGGTASGDLSWWHRSAEAGNGGAAYVTEGQGGACGTESVDKALGIRPVIVVRR